MNYALFIPVALRSIFQHVWLIMTFRPAILAISDSKMTALMYGSLYTALVSIDIALAPTDLALIVLARNLIPVIMLYLTFVRQGKSKAPFYALLSTHFFTIPTRLVLSYFGILDEDLQTLLFLYEVAMWMCIITAYGKAPKHVLDAGYKSNSASSHDE